MSALSYFWRASTPADRMLILALLLALPLLLWMKQSQAAGQSVHLFQGRQLLQVLPLNQDRRIAVPGPLGDTIVEIRQGRARVLSSPCPGQQCVHSGWLSHANDSAACLPNHVLVVVNGGDTRKDFDAVAE